MVVTFGFGGRETVAGVYSRGFWALALVVSRGAKPWQGCTQRALALAARALGRRRFWVEGSSLLVSRAAKPWQGRTLEGSGSSGARVDTRRHARARARARATRNNQRAPLAAHTNQHTRTHTH